MYSWVLTGSEQRSNKFFLMVSTGVSDAWVTDAGLVGFCIYLGGGLMTTFGDLGNYVNGFKCSPQEI